MTFLEYVATKLLGPCRGGRYFDCPVCSGEKKLSISAPDPKYKERYKCFACNAWGDEFDLLKVCRPRMNFADRKFFIEEMRIEYERNKPAVPEQKGPVRLTRYEREHNAYGRDPVEDEFCPASDAAAKELLAHLSEQPIGLAGVPDAFKMFEFALQICAKHKLHPLGMAARCNFEAWARDQDYKHMIACDDPECDARVCIQLRRGEL